MIRELTQQEQTKKDFNRILHNLGKYSTLQYLGNDWELLEMSKTDIKIIIDAMNKCNQENEKNELWQNDKQLLINLINNWCVVYRCYSLYIK